MFQSFRNIFVRFRPADRDRGSLPQKRLDTADLRAQGAHRILESAIIGHNNDILFMLCLFDHPDDLLVSAFLPRKNNLDR